VGLYSVGRLLIESLRLDSFWLGSFRVPQVASVIGILIAIMGILVTMRRARASAVSTG
jgi:prolipoprotein diacylglyceryltransferase